MKTKYIRQRIVEIRETYNKYPSKVGAAYCFAELYQYEQETRFNNDQKSFREELKKEMNFYLDEIEK